MAKIWEAINQILEYYPRCIKFTWKASRRYALLAFAFSILSSVVPAAQVWISKIVIDTVIQSLDSPTVDWFSLLSPIGAVVVVWMIGGICQSASRSLVEQIGFYTRNYSQHLIFSKTSRLDLAFFETPAFFDEMEKARGEGYRANNLAVLSVQIVSSIVSVTAMLVLLLEVHWTAPFVLLVTAVPQVVVVITQGNATVL
jgi:ATP-binding cassette subfamily B protein